MKTPITDAIWDQTKGIPEYHAKLEETSKRLETDRAALMEALEEFLAEMGAFRSDLGVAFTMKKATAALSAARTNFPS